MSQEYPGKALKFNGTSPMYGETVRAVERQLSRRGFMPTQLADGMFDLFTERAVKSFQLSEGMSPTGIVDAATWGALFKSNDVNYDTPAFKTQSVGSGVANVTPAPNENLMPSHTYDGTPKRTPFFNEDNSKRLRKSDMELRIDFGANSPLSKQIKHLYLRSVSVEVDASGQPIYEVFEFLAQDVEETDNVFIAK